MQNQFYGTMISLLLGSSCYTFEELSGFLNRHDGGLLEWFLKKRPEEFEYVFREGAMNKCFTGLAYYAEVSKKATKGEEMIDSSEQLDQHNLFRLLVFIDKLLNTKVSTKRVHPPTLNKLSKMLDDINGLDEKNS